MYYTATAFLRRDLLVAWSYRFAFFFEHAGVLLTLLTTRFIGELISGGTNESLRQYGGDYFSFALIGMGIQMLAYPALTAFRGAIREAQLVGTFEAMLTTRAHPLTIGLAAGGYPVVMASFRVLVTMMLIGLLMGARLSATEPLALVAALVLAMATFVGLGLFSAAFTIITRQNEPFTIALLSLSGVVSGVLYPVEVLPGWVQAVSPLLPMTHILELLRGLTLRDADVSLLTPTLGTAAFALTFPLGLLALNWAIEHARRRGTLAQY